MSPRLERLRATRVYLVVTPAAHGASWERALEAGLRTSLVGMVQLREKTMDDAAFLVRAKTVRRLCDMYDALFVVNDRIHLVKPAEADGVHLGLDDLPVEMARARLGSSLLVGLSTHDETEVAGAAARGADHVGLGPCFPTNTKRLAYEPGGGDLVRRCLPHAGDLPVFAIGGITADNVAEVAVGGRAAVGAGVLEAVDPAEAARRIHRALRAKGA